MTTRRRCSRRSRPGRTAISADRGGPVLLRAGDELVAIDADGSILTGPDGPLARVRGQLAKFAGADRLPPPRRPDRRDARADRLAFAGHVPGCEPVL